MKQILFQQRKEAMQQILNGERSQSDVAREFGISRQAVSLWIKRFREDGSFIGTGQRGRKVKGIPDELRDKLILILSGTTPSDHGIHAEEDIWCMETFNIFLKQQTKRKRKCSMNFYLRVMKYAEVRHQSFEEEIQRKLKHRRSLPGFTIRQVAPGQLTKKAGFTKKELAQVNNVLNQAFVRFEKEPCTLPAYAEDRDSFLK